MRYIELYAYPLSGKSTFLKSLNKNKLIQTKLVSTKKTFSRFLYVFLFLITNRELIKFYFKLPIKTNNFKSSFRKYLSFSGRYRDYYLNQNNKENTLLDEGICQSIWGLLTFFDYKNYEVEIDELVEYAFNNLFFNKKITIVTFNEVPYEEFVLRSKTRVYFHTYINSVIKKDEVSIRKYKYCFELILLKANKESLVCSKSDFLNKVNK
jgi:hypothetical protein